MGRLDRSDITASLKTGVNKACAVFHRVCVDTGGAYPNLSSSPNGWHALVTPLVFFVSMGSDNRLPLGDTLEFGLLLVAQTFYRSFF